MGDDDDDESCRDDHERRSDKRGEHYGVKISEVRCVTASRKYAVSERPNFAAAARARSRSRALLK
jgi:hypothetical protein